LYITIFELGTQFSKFSEFEFYPVTPNLLLTVFVPEKKLNIKSSDCNALKNVLSP